jgi:4-aminobutyrate aminotransferase
MPDSMLPVTSHAELLARHRAVLPRWVALYYDEPIALVDGSGRRVTDAEGRTYLDFFGGILTTMTGYNTPEVVAAVQEQAGKMLHSSTLYLIEGQIALAEQIAALSPVPDAKVFFGTSGTDGTETALLLATSYRRSNQVLAMRNSYHGRGFGAMGVTGNRSYSPTSYTPFQVHYVQNGDQFRGPYADLPPGEFTAACVADLRQVIDTMTSGDVACLIAEPIQGVGGFTMPPDGFYGALKSVLDEYGILFIADEVQTGWGRTGEHFWGIEAHGVVPDMVTFAKGIGNGLSIGGVIARAEIMDSLPAASISTFGGNPLVTAGALANLQYLLDHDLQANSLVRGQQLMAGLRELPSAYPLVGDVRGKGLMIGIDLVQPGTKTPNPAAAAAVMEHTREQGLLIGKGGLYGNVLRVAPPLSLTLDEAAEGLDILVKAIDAVSAELA